MEDLVDNVVMGEVTDSNAKDTSLADSPNISFYKDTIKKMKDELQKMKSENDKLRESIIAYTLRLPQISRKLNTLVTCLKAKVDKPNRRRKRRSNSEASDVQSCMDSVQEDDNGVAEEPQGEGSEVSARPSVKGIIPPPQKENSPGNAVIKHYSYCEGISQKFLKDSKIKKDFSGEIGLNSFPMTTGPDSKKSITLKITNISPVKNLREGITREVAKRKKSNDHTSDKKDLGKNISNASTDPENPGPEKTNSGCQENRSSETEIKREASVGGSATVESEAPGNGKGTKLWRLLPESASSGRAAQVIDSTVGDSVNNASGLHKGGQKRSYDCEVCGRTFTRSSNLAHHLMRHRNERPHQCAICDRAFVQKANLKVHLRSHTGERPYSCAECGRAFAQKNNAQRHLRAHVRKRQLQEQKLVCPHCAKTFGRWPSYETHIKSVHASSDSNVSGQVGGTLRESVANDARVGEVGLEEISHDVSNIPQVGNNMTHSQLPVDLHVEIVHPSAINIANLHASNTSNGPIPPNHDP